MESDAQARKVVVNDTQILAIVTRSACNDAHARYGGDVILRDTIDDLDVLIAELTDLRQALSHAELRGNPTNALWDAEAGLRRTAERAAGRAATVRRAIELLNQERRIA